MECQTLPRRYHYDGSQLRTGWIEEVSGIKGDAIVSFLGSCDVTPEHMLDTVDLEKGDGIRAKLMLHFIAEHPGISLDLAIARQRLLAALAKDALDFIFGVPDLIRDGDDLYVDTVAGDRKLSVSVAAVSPTSGLIHFALNVDDEGAPVPTISLNKFPSVEPRNVALTVLEFYAAEIESMAEAAAKVREAK